MSWSVGLGLLTEQLLTNKKVHGRMNAVKENQASYENQICTLKAVIEAEKAGRLESARLRRLTASIIFDNYGPDI